MDKKYLILIGGIVAAVIAMIIFNIRNIDNFSFYQTDDIIKKGNKEFDKKQYNNALKEYKKVDLYDTINYGAEYNEANSDYEMANYQLADSIYKNAARLYLVNNMDKKEMVDDEELARIYHNKGNANMKQTMPIDSVMLFKEMMDKMSEESGNQQMFQNAYPSLAKSWEKSKNAIEDYKNSLRRDAQSDSTRYNLALAQDYEKRLRDILQNITPPQNQNQQNQQDQQDQQNQKDQQNQDNQQNGQDDKEDERKETNEKGNQKDDQIPDLSKESAEQILKAIEKDEENTLKKIPLLNKGQQGKQRRHIEKNW